jgi:hypothetical protein
MHGTPFILNNAFQDQTEPADRLETSSIERGCLTLIPRAESTVQPAWLVQAP